MRALSDIPQQVHPAKRRLTIAGVVALAVILAVVGYLLLQLRAISSNVRPPRSVAAAVARQLTPAPVQASTENTAPAAPTYVLVMGGVGGVKPELSTLLLAKLDSRGGAASVLWIPPKALVTSEGRTRSASEAFASGGTAEAIRTVKALTGLPVHHYVRFETGGIAAVVDAMGGVWIDPSLVPEESLSPTAPPVARRGQRRLDGQAVLAYARTSAGGDASARQALLVVNAALSQAREKLLSPSAIPLLLSASESTESDLGTLGLLRFGQSMKSCASGDVRQHYLTGPVKGGWMRLDPAAPNIRAAIGSFAADTPAG